jgi:hypothetical protein
MLAIVAPKKAIAKTTNFISKRLKPWQCLGERLHSAFKPSHNPHRQG